MIRWLVLAHTACMLIACLLTAPFPARAQEEKPVDNSIFADLLDSHLKDGLVDYTAFKEDEPVLDKYLDVLAAVDPAALDDDERFAFYVNVYNAWTIKLILMNWPVDSIKDIGSLFSSPWSREIVRVHGGKLTLDNVEHDILRTEWDDPRVHFAVNCASMSCPPLRPEPYTGAKLNAQLDAQTRLFVNDPESTYLDGETLFVSKIFDWFEEDWGGSEENVVAFVTRYADPEFAARIRAAGPNVDVYYLDYDWSLNGLGKRP